MFDTLHRFYAFITSYLRNNPKYLVWPTISDFTESFFPKAGRYGIFVAGIQTAPVSFHDTLLMSRFGLFSHDFFHAISMQHGLKTNESFSFNVQKILDEVIGILAQLNADKHIQFFSWFCLFNYNHEMSFPLSELRTYGFFLKKGEIYKEIKNGKFVFKEGVSIEHLEAAYIILSHLFPEHEFW